jgi:acyl-coenzyme A synthetase/AMP-(fatty) acid ligase
MFHIKICREHEFAAVEQSVEAFTNILFSSGTTGNLKFELILAKLSLSCHFIFNIAK